MKISDLGGARSNGTYIFEDDILILYLVYIRNVYAYYLDLYFVESTYIKQSFLMPNVLDRTSSTKNLLN